MVFIERFCFWCSVRLGSLIIAIFTLIQASIFLTYTIILDESLKNLSEDLNKLLTTIKIDNELLYDIANNPKWFTIISTIFFVCLITSCISLLFGTIQCKSIYLYPFIVFYTFYILILLGIVVIFMLWIKVEGNGLGDLIFYSNLFGFILLFYVYTWACVVSFLQIIEELRRRILKKIKIAERIRNEKRKF